MGYVSLREGNDFHLTSFLETSIHACQVQGHLMLLVGCLLEHVARCCSQCRLRAGSEKRGS